MSPQGGHIDYAGAVSLSSIGYTGNIPRYKYADEHLHALGRDGKQMHRN